MARSEVNYTYEADLAYRGFGAAALTADAVVNASAATFGTATGIDIGTLDKLTNAREGSQKNKLGAEGYDVVIVVESAVTPNADEEYVFNLYVGDTGDGASGVLCGSTTVLGAGQYVISVDTNTLEKLDPDHNELALQLDVTGTGPSIVFAAWLAIKR